MLHSFVGHSVAAPAIILTTGVVLSAALACQPAPLPSGQQCLRRELSQGPEVARVGDVPLSVSDVTARAREQGADAVRRYSTPEKMRGFIEDQVRFELLVEAALERGLDRDPDVIDAARKVMVRKLLLADMGESATGRAVSQEAIQRYYDEHHSNYMQSEKRRMYDIRLAPTEEGRAQAVSIIRKLTAAANAKAPNAANLANLYRQQAMRHSTDHASRQRGGEVPFASKDEVIATYGPSYAARVFAMKAGALSEAPVQSTKGWHVVKVIAVRDALARGIDEVTEEIKAKLRRGNRSKLFEQYLSELKARHPIAIYDDRIEDVIAALEEPEKEKKP